MLCNSIEIAFRHGCSPVNLLHISRIPFPKNTSVRLLLKTFNFSAQLPRNVPGNAIVRLPNLRSEDNEGQETLLVAPYTEIIQNLQFCYLKFHGMNDDFQAMLKLSHNSNTLILFNCIFLSCHVRVSE